MHPLIKHKPFKKSPYLNWLLLLLLLLFFLAEVYFMLVTFPTLFASPATEKETSYFSNALLYSLETEKVPETEEAKKADQLLQKNNFIGTALVVQQGQVILQKGYGYADFQDKRANDVQTLYQLGSIQKGVTAALIMKQIEIGNLALSDTLDRFYPDVPNSKNTTIKQLLTMTSGLITKEQPKEVLNSADYLNYITKKAKLKSDGKYIYNAMNYYLLAGILQKLTNQTYEALFSQALASQIPLKHTLFYPEFVKDTHHAISYEKKDNQEYGNPSDKNFLSYSQEVGTGSLGTTTGDLYLFYRSVLTGKVVDLSIVEEVWPSTDKNKYSGGAYQYPLFLRGHGVKNGFESFSLVTKDAQSAVILLTNQEPKNASYQNCLEEIFQFISSYTC